MIGRSSVASRTDRGQKLGQVVGSKDSQTVLHCARNPQKSLPGGLSGRG